VRRRVEEWLVAARLLRVGEFRLALAACPLCGPTIYVRLRRDTLAVRCVRCKASPIHTATMTVILQEIPHLASTTVYEMSTAGPLVQFLRRRARELHCSEYFEGVEPGTHVDNILCQDVERLTFPDESFDLCTCTEVFEHVEDDRTGFAEVHRVLRPGGRLVFTVPLADVEETVERVRRDGGRLVHLLEPEYHGDRRRGPRGVLAFRTYGRDVTARLRAAGFASAEVVRVPDPSRLSEAQPVVVARKSRPRV